MTRDQATVVLDLLEQARFAVTSAVAALEDSPNYVSEANALLDAHIPLAQWEFDLRKYWTGR